MFFDFSPNSQNVTTNERPSVELIIPTPPSVNSAYRNIPGKGRAISKSYRKWRESIDDLWIRYKVKPHRVEPPYAVVYSINKYNNRIRDCANYEKCLSDLLVDKCILDDDSLIEINIQRWIHFKNFGNMTVCEIFSLT